MAKTKRIKRLFPALAAATLFVTPKKTRAKR